MDWSTAVPDWRERIVEGRSLIPFSPLFPDQAEPALRYFRDLRIVDAPGSPTIGESCRDWVTDFASAIFGAYDGEAGRRLIREFFLLISKKNSKSTTAAGIMLTALLRNWRQSAEFLIVAPTLEVANNSFFPARDMVKADDELADLLHVQEHLKTITHRTTGATLKVVAADNDTVSGKKATAVLIDELWLFGKRANAESMLREATGGLVSRPEGFVVYLTTQSDEPPAGVFKQKLQYFRDIRDGRIADKRSLPVIYEFPEEMVKSRAYLEPENFRITNPNLGVSVDEEWMRDKLREAQETGEDSLRGFVAKHLNIEIGLALRADRWAGADYWEAAAEPPLSLKDLIRRSEVITVGMDGGGLDDLFGLCVIGREADTGRWLVWNHTFCHAKVLERRKSEASKLRDFEKAGELSIFDRMGEDIEGVVALMLEVYESGLLAQIGADSAGITAFVDAINLAIFGQSDQPDGEEPLIVAVPQGYQLQQASKGCERKLADKSLLHAGQAIMAWAVGNAKTETRGNAMYITKAASGTAKIDPLMAMFDAAFLMARNPQARGSGYTGDSGLLVIG